jgi:hypothetical protein
MTPLQVPPYLFHAVVTGPEPDNDTNKPQAKVTDMTEEIRLRLRRERKRFDRSTAAGTAEA